MAGMLPGVECARRRRFYQGGSTDLPSGSRRPAFCLYRTGHESHISTNSTQRSNLSKELHGVVTLDSIAQKAKERLDERLKNQRVSDIKRRNSTGSIKIKKNGSEVPGLGNVQREVFCGKRRFGWTSKLLGWKAAEQEECVVCLEEFRSGDVLVNLPCAHRFHWSCVMPWLDTNLHCPCCRMCISSSSSSSSSPSS